MKTGFGIAISIFILITGIVLTLHYGRQPEDFPAASLSAQKLQPGPYAIAEMDVVLKDTTRSTDANGDYEGSASRQLTTTIWYPLSQQAQPFPVVIHSHGFSSMRRGGAYLGKHLASLGYVVAAADYPLTSYNAKGGPNVRDVVNQPADIRFIIDSLSRFNKDAEHPLFNRVDSQQVALMGISLGAMTSTMASYDPKRRDARVKASIALAGPTNLFSKRYFDHAPNVPMLMVASNQDPLVPHAQNAQPILKKVNKATLVTIKGGSHSAFAQTTQILRWLNNPDTLGCYIVLQNVKLSGPSWYHLIGTEDDGVVPVGPPNLCEQDPLPPAINPILQQRLTLLAVASFLESIFNTDAAAREAAQHFLMRQFPAEHAGITVHHNLTD